MKLDDIILNKFILIWLITFIGTWAIWTLLIKKHIANYTKNFLFSSLYFLLFSLLVGIYFSNQSINHLNIFTVKTFIVFIITLSLSSLIYYFSRKKITRPDNFIQKHPDNQVLSMNYRYLFTKFFEIIFQQTMILYLVIFLIKNEVDLIAIVFYFAILFGSIHFFLIKPLGKFFGIYYSLFAILSAVIFPILIIKFQNGFYYNFLIHYFFYTLSAVFFWWIYGNKKHKLQDTLHLNKNL